MGAADIGSGRSIEFVLRGERTGGQDKSERGGGDGIRSIERAAPESESAQARRRGSRAALHDASHRERCLVEKSVGARGLRALSGDERWKGIAARGAGDPVCRLCRVAERVFGWRGVGTRGPILEGAA